MTREQVQECLEDIYNTLELRVGRRLARKMTSIQLSQFERLVDAKDEEGALKWLNANYPDYSADVMDEFDFVFERLKAAVVARREAVGALQGEVE
jgi:hypothetical protein